MNYYVLTDGASRFIDTLTLTWDYGKYSAMLTAEARSSPGISPVSHGQSPSLSTATAEATSLFGPDCKNLS